MSNLPEQSSASLRAIQEFVAKPQSWGILNGTPEDITLDWGGERLVVPSCNRTIEPHPRAASDRSFVKFCSYCDEKGYVAGTLVIHDLVKVTVDGQVPIWSARSCISNKLSIDPLTGRHYGQWGLRGLRLFALDATREELESLKEQSHSAWEEWAIKNANATMTDWYERRKKDLASGLPEPIPPDHVNEAALLLKTVAQKRGKAVMDLLGAMNAPANQMVQPPPQPTFTKAEMLASILADPELKRQLAAAVIEEAAQGEEKESDSPPKKK